MKPALETDDLRASIAKLLPMLAADGDSEVVAAARAITRKLQAAGRDLHWLADEVTAPAYIPAPFTAAQPAPASSAAVSDSGAPIAEQRATAAKPYWRQGDDQAAMLDALAARPVTRGGSTWR